MSAKNIVSSTLKLLREHTISAALVLSAIVIMAATAIVAFGVNGRQPAAVKPVDSNSTASQISPKGTIAEKAKTTDSESKTDSFSSTSHTGTKPPSTAAAPAPAKNSDFTPPRPALKGYTPPAAATEPGTFFISISHESAYIDEHGQVVAPFSIQREDGYSLSMGMPETRVTQTPEGATNISCSAGFKDTDQGFIAIYGPDDAPSGTYACDLIIKSGFITRTATLYFAYYPHTI